MRSDNCVIIHGFNKIKVFMKCDDKLMKNGFFIIQVWFQFSFASFFMHKNNLLWSLGQLTPKMQKQHYPHSQLLLIWNFSLELESPQLSHLQTILLPKIKTDKPTQNVCLTGGGFQASGAIFSVLTNCCRFVGPDQWQANNKSYCNKNHLSVCSAAPPAPCAL